jgi:response regulator RpfG family c-di-GMP phosphodiesterase
LDLGDSPLPAGEETVMVVEDEDNLREAVSRMLETHGYRVMKAGSGREGLRLLEAHRDDPLHLLLSNVVMPEMLGKELASRVAELSPGTRILFMSGFAQPILGPT